MSYFFILKHFLKLSYFGVNYFPLFCIKLIIMQIRLI
uniref:Uncharacterized protein n=1 Tax=Myoviridae sp. ct0wg9 TaxID=2826600 RepID=A0A8S5NGX9_9CAUD|nr:MAG TPA: hypothetical protein [Myoviridae sp. ct0wg9]